jgi:FkbM family methyltransferase
MPVELSYTQNMEDYHLWLGLGGASDGFYIDIGAGHPVADNVSFWFYERGWRGVAVEPIESLTKLYAHVRPRDRTVATLIGRENGETEFYEVDRLHGFSTTVEQFARGAGQFGARYRGRKMPIVTLAELCARYADQSIDFLKIDVEGAEADVLAGGDWKRFRPKVVVCEAILPGSNEPGWQAWEPFLLAQGYRFVLFDTLNRFYVAEEQTAVLERFPRERAPWDAVRHMYEIGRAPEDDRHPDHAVAKGLTRAFWASLPTLDAEVLARLLAHSRGEDVSSQMMEEVRSDAFRRILGRIACGYDGGQIFDE